MLSRKYSSSLMIRYQIMALFIILFSVAVGYALPNNVFSIEDTATINSQDWDIQFINVNEQCSSHSHNAMVEVKDDTMLNISTNLCFPGDVCTFKAKIKNKGNIDAYLKNAYVTDENGKKYSDDLIVVQVPELENEILNAGETCEFTFVIYWNPDVEIANSISVSRQFKINLQYEQNLEKRTKWTF